MDQLLQLPEGPACGLIKANVPLSDGRETLSDKEGVLKAVEGILNKRTPDKFDLLKAQLIDSGITTVDVLKGVVSLIYNKAIQEPELSPMYAQLGADLTEKLPDLEKLDGKVIRFMRVLLNKCQETFEGAELLRSELKLMTVPEQEAERKEKERMIQYRFVGNIRLIGEIFKLGMLTERIAHEILEKLMGPDKKICPKEEDVEAICQFINTIGKLLDETPKSRHINDRYFSRLKKMSTAQQLAPHIRLMVRDVLDLRSNNWAPRRVKVKAKTMPVSFTDAGMYGTRMKSAPAPARPVSFASAVSVIASLQCIEELKSPSCHPEFVKEAIYLSLEKGPPCVEPVVKLLQHLYSKKVLTKEDLRVGCVLYGSLLVDIQNAPNNFGEILGMLVVGGELDFKVVEEVLKNIEDDSFQKAVFLAVMKIVSSSPSGQVVLGSQAAEIAACVTLF